MYASNVKAVTCPLPSKHSQEHDSCSWHGGKIFTEEGSSPVVSCLQRSLLGWQGKQKTNKQTTTTNPQRSPYNMLWVHTNLSKNYRWALHQTLKACPSTLTPLLIGLGKERRDTVKSESLFENQIHRLEKFSGATPSWPVGKPQGACQSLQGGQSWGQDVTHLPQSHGPLLFPADSLWARAQDYQLKQSDVHFFYRIVKVCIHIVLTRFKTVNGIKKNKKILKRVGISYN